MWVQDPSVVLETTERLKTSCLHLLAQSAEAWVKGLG